MLSVGPEEKEAFRDNKNDSFVKCEKRVFSKGINPWFQSRKWKFFLVCFFGLEIIFSYVLHTKQGFHNNKNVNFVRLKK